MHGQVHGVDLLISVGTLPPVLDVEILMKTLVLAAAAVLIAASTAGALITSNGPQLTGIAAQAIAAKQPVVHAVTLPSSETIGLQ